MTSVASCGAQMGKDVVRLTTCHRTVKELSHAKIFRRKNSRLSAAAGFSLATLVRPALQTRPRAPRGARTSLGFHDPTSGSQLGRTRRKTIPWEVDEVLCDVN